MQFPWEQRQLWRSAYQLIWRKRRWNSIGSCWYPDSRYESSHILNMDETPMQFELPAMRALEFSGNRTGPTLSCGGDKQSFTVVLAVKANGEKLPPKVIFKGVCHLRIKVPPRMQVTVHKGWMDEGLFLFSFIISEYDRCGEISWEWGSEFVLILSDVNHFKHVLLALFALAVIRKSRRISLLISITDALQHAKCHEFCFFYCSLIRVVFPDICRNQGVDSEKSSFHARALSATRMGFLPCPFNGCS